MNSKVQNHIAVAGLWVTGLFILSLLAAFLGYILYKGLPVLNFHFIFAKSSDIMAGGGVGAQLFNSFYMLLLSIAEHTGFDIAFGIAATATVALISAYAGWTFKSRGQGIRALVAFTFLYGLIYVLMRLEDYALLVGALASFAAIFAVMYFTRKLDWYGITGAATKDIS